MASSFGNRVTTITQDYLAPKLVDTVLNSNVGLTRFISAAKKWRGEQMKYPIKVSQNSTGSSFSGFDTFSTSASNTRIKLAYDPKFYKITVTLPLDELSVNATEDKVLDLAAIEMSSSAQDMADDLGTIFYSDGTGNSGKNPLGLGALCDDGTNVATIGEQTRATYSTLCSTVTDSGGALSLAKMTTLYHAIQSGTQKPSIGLTTQTVFGLYEQLLNPQERIVKDISTMKGGLTGGAGFTGLWFKGFPIIADEKCTSDYLYFLNEDYIDWVALPVWGTEPIKYKSDKIEGNDYDSIPKGLGFSWSGWIKPSNSGTVISHIYMGGNFITTNPKRHGVLTGITSV